MFSQIKHKKAVSVIIGYVILVSFVIVLGIIVYSWMKTYVPKDELNCPDGTSIFIKSYECSSNTLTLHLSNNGKFNIGGYFIYVTNSPQKELATIDISRNNTDELSIIRPTGIKFSGLESGNLLKPNDEETEIYDLTGLDAIYSVEILPIRWQEEKNKLRLVSCKDVKIKESIQCKKACTPALDPSTSGICGSFVCGTAQNGTCGAVSCGADCNENFFCDAEGQCISSLCTPALDPSTSGICGSFVCGTAQNGTCGAVSCGTCDLTNALSGCPSGSCIVSSCVNDWCNSDGIDSNGCEAPIGTLSNCGSCGDVCTTGTEVCTDGSCTSCNGVWISPENTGVECDGTPLPANCIANCTCTGGYVSNGIGGCKIPNFVNSCTSYCDFLNYNGIPPGECTNSPGNCVQGGGIYEAFGDQWCTRGSQADTCCCKL